MFDQTEDETGHWADEIQRGNVVLFRFPIRRAGEGEGPKVRPCLVLEVEELSGGTSVPESKNRGYEIPVTHVEDIRAAGLKRATRFIGARLISVAPENAGFDVGGPISSPVIGRLSPNRMERLDWVRARLHAEHDIATERRRRRFGRGPTVERRRRKILVHSPSSAARRARCATGPSM